MADDKTTTGKNQTGDDNKPAAKSGGGDKSGDKPAKVAKAKSTKAKTAAKPNAKAADKSGEKVDDKKTSKTKAAAKPRAKTAKTGKAESGKSKPAGVAENKTEVAKVAKAAEGKVETAEVAEGKVETPETAEGKVKTAEVAEDASKTAASKTSKAKGKTARAKDESSAARFYGTGRRKEATARVFLRPGNGDFVVNKKPIEDFFPRARSQMIARQALKVMGEHGESGFDVYATVVGGGESGQAEAVRHGVSRAMVAYRPDCKPILRAAGFIARDARAVERKKVGLRKARRARQYSKR